VETSPSPASAAAFDRAAHSTTDPSSIWVIVNKTHPAAPLEALLADSDREGLGFKIASAFRSFDYQESVHAATVSARGRAEADRVSARAGFSEHQTGLAVDLTTPVDPACDFDACFAGTPGGRWLPANAWRYGFVVRYQPDTVAVTGYSPEPWHLRYVGRALAAELRRTDVATLEEFFGVHGGDYRP
jgi:D-alanyl-D-alanine carboxypeptidase